MAVAADDDVVMDGDAQGLGDIDQLARHPHVGAGGRRVAGGMVVDNA